MGKGSRMETVREGAGLLGDALEGKFPFLCIRCKLLNS